MQALRALAPFVGLGRHRKPDPPARVTVVLSDGREVVLPPDSALARAMGQVARLLAHR
jgi:hypothetical protein